MTESPNPCPFCGSSDVKPEEAGYNGLGHAVCQSCRAHGPESPITLTVATWNHRAKPVSTRGGEVLQAVVSAFFERRRWSVAELRLRAKGASKKEVYNAVGYLARKGKIQRLSYGQYAAVAA